MKTNLLRAGVVACALWAGAPALAQYANCVVKDAGGACVPGHALVVGAATSTPLTGSVTASGATPSSGACAFASGTATCGPFVPQLGLPVRLVVRGGASFSGYVGTSIDGCASVNPLTAGGVPQSYAAQVDEYVDLPPTSGSVAYCLVLSVTSGTATYAVRQ